MDSEAMDHSVWLYNDRSIDLSLGVDVSDACYWFVGYLEALFEDREVVVLAEYEREVEQFLW